jgi:hypothetical protein
MPYDDNDGVDRCSNSRCGPHTAEGIGFGSTVDDITTAYPTAEATANAGDVSLTPYYVVKKDNGNWMTFAHFDEANTAKVTSRVSVWAGMLPPYEYCG